MMSLSGGHRCRFRPLRTGKPWVDRGLFKDDDEAMQATPVVVLTRVARLPKRPFSRRIVLTRATAFLALERPSGSEVLVEVLRAGRNRSLRHFNPGQPLSTSAEDFGTSYGIAWYRRTVFVALRRCCPEVETRSAFLRHQTFGHFLVRHLSGIGCDVGAAQQMPGTANCSAATSLLWMTSSNQTR